MFGGNHTNRRRNPTAVSAAESYLILSVAESFTCLLVGYIFAGAFCATIGSLALFECFAWWESGTGAECE